MIHKRGCNSINRVMWLVYLFMRNVTEEPVRYLVNDWNMKGRPYNALYPRDVSNNTTLQKTQTAYFLNTYLDFQWYNCWWDLIYFLPLILCEFKEYISTYLTKDCIRVGRAFLDPHGNISQWYFSSENTDSMLPYLDEIELISYFSFCMTLEKKCLSRERLDSDR